MTVVIDNRTGPDEFQELIAGDGPWKITVKFPGVEPIVEHAVNLGQARFLVTQALPLHDDVKVEVEDG